MEPCLVDGLVELGGNLQFGDGSLDEIAKTFPDTGGDGRHGQGRKSEFLTGEVNGERKIVAGIDESAVEIEYNGWR
jgi:hypothetical protein